MEQPNRNIVQIDLIRNDLNRIIDEWRKLHFRLAIVFVVIAFIIECILAVLIANSEILTTTVARYIVKFIAIPSGLAGISLAAGALALRSRHVDRNVKIYTVSLLFVFICFIYFTAHSAFIVTASLYVFAIFLTTTYADYCLTGVVSAFSVVSLFLSELFLRWDLDKVSIFADSSRMLDFLVTVCVLLGCSLVANVTIHYERRKNQASLRREVERKLLKESLQRDELTGVFNRKALHEALHELEVKGSAEPLVFCIADIDHFKSVNDQHGHHLGDLFLTEFACMLVESFGESSVYRYGGDEFCLILRNMTAKEAMQWCERAQTRFRRVKFDEAPDLLPTASFGLTVYSAKDGAARLFDQADIALYEAKKTRNAIRIYGVARSKKTAQAASKANGESD